MSCVCKFFSWETASCYCLQSQRMSGWTSLTISGSLSADQHLETQSLPTTECWRNGLQSSVCKILFSVFIFSFRFVGVAEADPANIYPSQVLCVEFLGVQWELSPGRAQACSGLSMEKFSCIFWSGFYIHIYTYTHIHVYSTHMWWSFQVLREKGHSKSHLLISTWEKAQWDRKQQHGECLLWHKW